MTGRLPSELDDATRPPAQNVEPANAQEFAAMWNRREPDERERMFEIIRENSKGALRCFIEAHSVALDLAYTDRDAALERLGAVLAERDQLARLHEVATERTVELASIIARVREVTSRYPWTGLRYALENANDGPLWEGAKTDG